MRAFGAPDQERQVDDYRAIDGEQRSPGRSLADTEKPATHDERVGSERDTQQGGENAGPGPAHEAARHDHAEEEHERRAGPGHRLEQLPEPERHDHHRHGERVASEGVLKAHTSRFQALVHIVEGTHGGVRCRGCSAPTDELFVERLNAIERARTRQSPYNVLSGCLRA